MTKGKGRHHITETTTDLGKAIRESTIVNQVSPEPIPLITIPGSVPPTTPSSPANSGTDSGRGENKGS